MSQSIIPTLADTVNNDIVATVDQAMQDLNMCEKQFCENEIQDILMYFKTCMVSTEKSALIEKLFITHAQILSKNIWLKILTDFALTFKETNDRYLVEKWPFIAQRITELNEAKYDACYDQIDVKLKNPMVFNMVYST